MKTVLSLILIATLGACAPISNPERTFLVNPATGEIVACEKGHIDSFIDATGICIKQKEKQGFDIVNVTKFDRFGRPVEYAIEEDPFWPNN